MSIECHRCSSHNAEGSHFCDQCGSPLGVGEPGKTKKSLSRLWVLLTVCALGWFLHDQIDLERGERGRDRDGGASESGTSNDALGDRTSEVLEDPATNALHKMASVNHNWEIMEGRIVKVPEVAGRQRRPCVFTEALASDKRCQGSVRRARPVLFLQEVFC